MPLRLSPPPGSRRTFVVWSTPSPSPCGLRCPPSALYTFPRDRAGLARRRLGRARPGRSPSLTGATWAVSRAGLKSSSPLCLPVSPLGRGAAAGRSEPARPRSAADFTASGPHGDTRASFRAVHAARSKAGWHHRPARRQVRERADRPGPKAICICGRARRPAFRSSCSTTPALAAAWRAAFLDASPRHAVALRGASRSDGRGLPRQAKQPDAMRQSQRTGARTSSASHHDTRPRPGRSRRGDRITAPRAARRSR